MQRHAVDWCRTESDAGALLATDLSVEDMPIGRLRANGGWRAELGYVGGRVLGLGRDDLIIHRP